MPKDDVVRARIDSEVKQQAEVILARLGMNMSDAINLFLRQVTLRGGLPFEVRIPSNDLEYHKNKDSHFKERIQQMNINSAQGLEDFETGRFLSPEESKARIRARLQE
jgi:addiction module RelB/DinJ family antitoxin